MDDRTEIIDALYRFALGQDRQDRELFASAFAADAELDFRPAAAGWGAKPPLMSGRETIVSTILGSFAGRVVTTHQVTNPRVTIDGDRAHVTALVEAQHLLSADRATHALLKNHYDVTLTREPSAGRSSGCGSTTPGTSAIRRPSSRRTPPAGRRPEPAPPRPALTVVSWRA